MAKKITILLGNDGKIETDYDGFSGADCYTESKTLKDALSKLGLSNDLISDTIKPEIGNTGVPNVVKGKG
jgi:hypothetical protein